MGSFWRIEPALSNKQRGSYGLRLRGGTTERRLILPCRLSLVTAKITNFQVRYDTSMSN